MAWHDILTRNIGWKAVSMLLAVIIWNVISQVPDGFQGKTPPKPDNTPINPMANGTDLTNSVNITKAFDIRVLKLPDDPTRYILEPAQVTLSLGSDADPAPDLTSPSAVKVVLDPIDIPLDVIKTNKQVEVFAPEGTIIKGKPKVVMVTRVIEEPTGPTKETEPAEEDTDKTEDEDNGE